MSSGTPAHVVLYATTAAFTAKIKKDIERIRRLLHIKGVAYEEVDLAAPGQLHHREQMLLGSNGLSSLPQLHVNGKLIGDSDYIQELEDFGELDAKLRGL